MDRLNAEDDDAQSATAEFLADVRLVLGLLHARALPLLYPAAVGCLCWQGLRDF